LEVRIDLPGAKPENVSVETKDGVLTVSAKVEHRKETNAKALLREYGVGDYYRSFRLGRDIAADRIGAEFKDGVLTLQLPKEERAKTKKIAVQAV
jgi:HSP20 family protein